MIDKLELLKTKHKKEFDIYFKAMSFQIMSVEIDALFNVLVLNKPSKYELTRRHETNVKRILKIK